jgi:hypothetical protein
MNSIRLAIFLVFFLLTCCSKEPSTETIEIDNLKIIKTERLDSKAVVMDVFNGSEKRLQKFRYNDGISFCDSSVYVRTWLGIIEFPNHMEMYDEQDSVIEQTECAKNGESLFENVGKQFIYDCIRFKYDTKHRIKVDGKPFGRTKKTYKQVTNFKLRKSCLGQDRTLVSDVEYDYELKRVKKTIYNQNGNVESISYLTYPFGDILEKKLYIDGEYIRTKCFANDSLKIDAKEFIDEKESCLE